MLTSRDFVKRSATNSAASLRSGRVPSSDAETALSRLRHLHRESLDFLSGTARCVGTRRDDISYIDGGFEHDHRTGLVEEEVSEELIARPDLWMPQNRQESSLDDAPLLAAED